MKRIGFWLAVGAMALTTSAMAEDAAKLYTAKCQSCHGKDGKGNPAMTKARKVDAAALSLVDADSLGKTDEALVKVTLDGAGKMPKYRGKVSDADAKALVAHVRGLAPKPAK